MKTAASQKISTAPRLPILWIYFGLIAGTILIYWPVHKFDFVAFDDSDFVTANSHVQAGLTWDSFKWAWHSEVARNWHPITMLTHMLDCQLFELNAGGHHLTNLVFHTANVVLLFFVFQRMTGAIWRSAFVAALFAWHPLHVESVAWIAERKDVLSTFFLFLTLWSYVRYAQTKSSRFYALALLLFALGLMSKPMLVTAPFVFLLLDYWPLRRSPYSMKLMVEKIPFFALSSVLCVITFFIQQHGGAVQATASLPLISRFENALVSYVRYIGKLFWPESLTALYLRSGGWPLWIVALAAAGLIIVSIIAFKQWRSRPWLGVGWCWFLGMLVPVIGIVQVGMQSMADRFTYAPLIGLFIIVAWGGSELAARWRLPKSSVIFIAAILLTICMGLTAHQVGYWKDSETLFTRMIAVNPNNFMAHYNLGNVYSRQKRYDDALAQYQKAVEAEPNYAEARNNYGGLLLDLKRYDEAIQQYRDAIRVNPQYLYYFNLANALADAASARKDANQFAEAERTYAQALALNPKSAEVHVNLALTWEAQGRDAEAIAEYREALQLNPALESAHIALGNILSRIGKLDDAIAEYIAAIRLNPKNTESYNGLGICYAMKNDMPEAATQFKRLLEIDPQNGSANGNLANALAAQNRLDEAIPYYAAALRINPRDFQSEFNLGLSLAREGRREEAAAHYREALRIKPDYAEAQRALQALQAGNMNQK